MDAKEMASRLARLETQYAALHTAMYALMRTAPDQLAFHLTMTKTLELGATERAGPFRGLTDQQVQQVRNLVEYWGTTPDVPPNENELPPSVRPTSRP